MTRPAQVLLFCVALSAVVPSSNLSAQQSAIDRADYWRQRGYTFDPYKMSPFQMDQKVKDFERAEYWRQRGYQFDPKTMSAFRMDQRVADIERAQYWRKRGYQFDPNNMSAFRMNQKVEDIERAAYWRKRGFTFDPNKMSAFRMDQAVEKLERGQQSNGNAKGSRTSLFDRGNGRQDSNRPTNERLYGKRRSSDAQNQVESGEHAGDTDSEAKRIAKSIREQVSNNQVERESSGPKNPFRASPSEMAGHEQVTQAGLSQSRNPARGTNVGHIKQLSSREWLFVGFATLMSLAGLQRFAASRYCVHGRYLGLRRQRSCERCAEVERLRADQERRPGETIKEKLRFRAEKRRHLDEAIEEERRLWTEKQRLLEEARLEEQRLRAEQQRLAEEARLEEQRLRAEQRRLEQIAKEEEIARLRLLEAERLRSLSYLQTMPPIEFERIVLQAFRNLGWEAKETKISGDDGVDGILIRNGQKHVVQCKRLSMSRVGSPVLRDLLGATIREGASHGIIVTTTSFTPDAIRWSAGQPLILVDGQELIDFFTQAFPTGIGVPRDFVARKQAEASLPKACPVCGHATSKKKGRFGQFFGCTNYPDCKWTRDLPEELQTERTQRLRRRFRRWRR